MDSSIPMTMPNDISFVDVLVQWLETPGVDSKGNTRTPGDILRDYMKWHAQQHPRADPVPMLKTVVGQALQEYATNHKNPSAASRGDPRALIKALPGQDPEAAQV